MEQKTLSLMLLTAFSLIFWLVWDQFRALPLDLDHQAVSSDELQRRNIEPKDLIDLEKVTKITDDYINKTSAIQRLYDTIYQTNLEHPYPIDQNYSSANELRISGWPHSNQTKCGRELAWIQMGLDRFGAQVRFEQGKRADKLSAFVDSFGKPESGLYKGLVTWMGSYRICKSIDFSLTNDNPDGQFKTNFCWSRFRFKSWPKDESLQMKPEVSIRVGSCLPESCDTQSAQQYAKEIEQLVKFDWPNFYKEDLEFISMFCLPDEQSPLRRIPFEGRVFLCVMAIWVLAVLIATVVCEKDRLRMLSKQKASIDAIELQHSQNGTDCLEAEKLGKVRLQSNGVGVVESTQAVDVVKGRFAELSEALSLRHTLKMFVRDTSHVNYKHCDERPRVDFSWLNFLKLFMCLVVVERHTAFIGQLYVRSLSYRASLLRGANGQMNLSFARLFDTFFIILSLLSSNHLLSKFRVKQLSNPVLWFYFNFKVLLRVGPILMVVYCFARYVSPYIGSGPWWDYGVDKQSLRGSCLREPWWTMIPYFGSFNVGGLSRCLIPGWFLSDYLQLSLVIPLMLYIIHTLPSQKWRISFLSFIVLISHSLMATRLFRQNYLNDGAFFTYGAFLMNLLQKYQDLGEFSSYSHIGQIAFGCYLGDLLKRYKSGEIQKWPKWLSSRLLLIIVLVSHLLVQLTPNIGDYLIAHDWVSPSLELEILGSFIVSITWQILNLLLILQTATVYNGTSIIRFFSHPVWTSLNKLGLCIFLIHWEVLMFNFTVNESGPSIGFAADLCRQGAFTYSLVIIISLLAYFLIESPITNMFFPISKKLETYFKRYQKHYQGDRMG